MKRFLLTIWLRGERSNYDNVISLVEHNPKASFLDCGCGNGDSTLRVAFKVGTKEIFGIEIAEDLASAARQKGIKIKQSDLNRKIPFDDASFDVVVANQVIEHLYNRDNFIREIFRILKRGGYAVISTENLASWHNIFSLLFGWQPFSLTNISSHKLGMGNPLALHRNENLSIPSMQHVGIFAYRGLKEFLEINGFKVEKILGAGYYPLPTFFAKIDPRHSAFLTIKVRKI